MGAVMRSSSCPWLVWCVVCERFTRGMSMRVYDLETMPRQVHFSFCCLRRLHARLLVGPGEVVNLLCRTIC